MPVCLIKEKRSEVVGKECKPGFTFKEYRDVGVRQKPSDKEGLSTEKQRESKGGKERGREGGKEGKGAGGREGRNSVHSLRKVNLQTKI